MKHALMIALLTTFAAGCSSMDHSPHGSGDMKEMKTEKPTAEAAPAETEKKTEQAPAAGG
jgi:heat shock protein HslJ